MYQIVYISDSNKHFQQAIDEYIKRFWKNLKLVKLKPTKNGTSKQIIEKDTENVNKFLEKTKNSYNILLSLDGQMIDSIAFAKKLDSILSRWTNINFIIWWAFGLDEAQLKNIDYKLKFSPMTFPHWLALLVLLEQIYRAVQINNWRSYHY